MTFRSRVIEHQKAKSGFYKELKEVWLKLQQNNIYGDEWLERINEYGISSLEDYVSGLEHYKFHSYDFLQNHVEIHGESYSEAAYILIPYEAFDDFDNWILERVKKQGDIIGPLKEKEQAEATALEEEREQQERKLYERLKEKFES
jgi:hypothetical protein